MPCFFFCKRCHKGTTTALDNLLWNNQRVLPNPQHFPASTAQFASHRTVAQAIFLELSPPVLFIGSRVAAMLRAAMPEATINKHRKPLLAKNKIWPPWQFLMTQPAIDA